jgi:hypothetical protein
MLSDLSMDQSKVVQDQEVANVIVKPSMDPQTDLMDPSNPFVDPSNPLMDPLNSLMDPSNPFVDPLNATSRPPPPPPGGRGIGRGSIKVFISNVY